MARLVGSIVDGGIDDALIHALPKNCGGTFNQRFNKQRAVEFIDVVLVRDGAVKAPKSGSDLLREITAFVIEEPRQEKTKDTSRYRDPSEHQFLVLDGLDLGFFSGSRQCALYDAVRVKHGRQEIVEVVMDTYPSTNKREDRKDHEWT